MFSGRSEVDSFCVKLHYKYALTEKVLALGIYTIEHIFEPNIFSELAHTVLRALHNEGIELT